MGKINILFVIDRISIGGNQRQLYYILKNLNKNKYESFLLYFEQTESVWEIFHALNNINVANWKKFALSRFSKTYGIYKTLKENNIHIIHSLSNKTNISSITAARYAKTPLKITAGAQSGFFPVPGLKTLGEIRSKKYSDIVTAESLNQKDILLKAGFMPERIKVVQRGIDTAFFNPEKLKTGLKKKLFGRMNPSVITYIGRIDAFDGIPEFLKEARIACSTLENVVFMIVGHGRYRKKWEKLVKNMRMEERFLFTGFRYDVKEIFSISDIIFSPFTKHTVYGNSILEAMASAKPVVAAKTNANLEIIEDGVNGLLYSPLNEKEMADAIILLLKNKELSEKLGANARKTIAKVYSVDETLKDIEEIYY